MRLPEGFLVGASTSAHQTEGNNIASDFWELESRRGSPLKTPSGDACNSWERWRDDIDLVARSGMNAYRFGIEWARIEPVQGRISRAALLHYWSMVEYCRQKGLEPVVTLHHASSPAWFARKGRWSGASALEDFGRYLEVIAPVIKAGVSMVITINEPNMIASFGARSSSDKQADPGLGGLLHTADPRVTEALVTAHHYARERLHELYPGLKVGWTIASQVVQALPGGEENARRYYASIEKPFLEAAQGDDFVGVQSYSRVRFGAHGFVEPSPQTRQTLSGWEFYPPALGRAIHDAFREVGKATPILVTENGIATADDAERIEYTRGALAGMAEAMEEGIPVIGYLHWSLLDNWEFGSFKPTFGLVSVNHENFERIPKRSLSWLGAVAVDREIPVDWGPSA